MGKKALKLDSPASESANGTAENSTSGKRAIARPRKSLMRKHRQKHLQASLSEDPSSPQAESPLLTPDQETPPHSTVASPRTEGIKGTSRLSSKSLHWPKRGGNTDNNEINVGTDTLHDEQSPTATARRSSVLSWGSRNSTTSIVESAPPRSCLLACQPSVRLIGSLRGTINEMHLPLLSNETKSRLNVLKAAPKQQQLEVTIKRSDELPFGAYSHPQVRVHVVDRCTGRALCPVQMTNEASFGPASDNNDNSTNAFEWQQVLSISVDMPAFLNPRTALLFEVVERKKPSKGSLFRHGKRFESVSSHDPEDDGFRKAPESASTAAYRRIAWGFFHAITNKGYPTMNSFAFPLAPGGTDQEMEKCRAIKETCGLQVQLFAYQMMTWMDHYQAKTQWGWRKNHPTVPAVFLQYQKRTRAPAPCTLHVQLRAVDPANSPRQASTPRKSDVSTSAEVAACDELDDSSTLNPASGGDNQEQSSVVASPPSPDKTGDNGVRPDEVVSDPFDLLAPCKRNPSEPCLIPQRVMCSLPTGKKGCSAVSFSPCGRYIAAGVSPEPEEFVVRVYHVASTELLAVGRGHRGVIYSLQWNARPNILPRLLSASSDGTVRLWELPSEIGSISSPIQSAPNYSRLLPLLFQWHHFPCFVYCAIFLPGSVGDIVLTGASDGCLRFRKESSIPNGQPEYGMLNVSSVAVHSICAESNAGRVFCGDAKGDITVWKRVAPQPGSRTVGSGYELVKTIRTGQTSISSLQLHPRKAHLLVHTQPNAIFQYELRSYLLLNKSYAGVTCENLLVKSTFSPDGKLVISGSEDGVPRLFTSLHGQQLHRSVWGTHFFHDYPVLDVSWSPTAHMAALCSYGGNNPIVVLCAYRDDKNAAFVDNSATKSTANVEQLAVEAFRSNNQHDVLNSEHAQRLQRALERRRQRLQAKLIVETEASSELAASAAV